MMGFVAAALLLLVCVLFFLLRPLLNAARFKPKEESDSLAILREQRSELNAERAAGRLSEAVYAQSLAELEQRVAVEALQRERVPTERAPVVRWARLWAVALTVMLVLGAGGLYSVLGNPAALNPQQTGAAAMKPAEINAMVAAAAARIKAHPEDIKGAQMLGRSYMVLGRYAEAVELYAGLAKQLPNDAQVYADWADAAAGAQQGQFGGEPERLINKALQLDAHNLKALALAGTMAFDKEDYRHAAELWQQVLAGSEPGSDFAKSVEAMIAEAQTKAGMPATSASAPASPAADAKAALLSIQGEVSVAADLAKEVAGDEAVFLFARPVAGGPPVAGMRFKASELPIRFDFSKAIVMAANQIAPDAKLIVGARISKSGNAMPSPGDLQGISKPLPIDAKGVVIKIDSHYAKP